MNNKSRTLAKTYTFGLALIIPSFLIWFVFGLLPNLQIFYLAFCRWNGISKAKKFVGLENFKILSLDPQFSRTITNTIIYILFMVIIQNMIALLLALLLKKNTRSNNFFRTFFFSPVVIATVMIGLTWGYMYDPNMGVINYVLNQTGLGSLQQDWLGIPVLSVCCVAVVHLWHDLGYALTLILAGLQTIPVSLYESAKVEGSGGFQTFSRITLPLLTPTLLRVVLLTIIGSSLAFDYVYVMGSSYRSSEFDTMAAYMFKAISAGTINVGLPSAVGVLLALVIFAIFIIQYFLTRKVEEAYL